MDLGAPGTAAETMQPACAEQMALVAGIHNSMGKLLPDSGNFVLRKSPY
jgi:hypothetical protein